MYKMRKPKRHSIRRSRLAASIARQNFADTLNRVIYRGERIVLFRRGRDLAAVIPLPDLHLLEILEDRIDTAEARRALKESDERFSYDKIRGELGLKK